jgi:hypothetical protein
LAGFSHDLVDLERRQKMWFLCQFHSPSHQDLIRFITITIAFVGNRLDRRFPILKTHRLFLLGFCFAYESYDDSRYRFSAFQYSQMSGPVVEPIAVILNQLPVGIIPLDLQFVQREVNGTALVLSSTNDAAHFVNHRFIGIAQTDHLHLDGSA